MYTLINELWSSQQYLELKHQLNIPQTIIISPGFHLSWYFSKDNKILKRTDQKCNIENIIHYFAQTKTKINIITVTQPYSVEQLAEINLQQETITLEQLCNLLRYYHQFPHLIINHIYIQEQITNSQMISFTWNKNYTFIQECDSQTFQKISELKITQHFRASLDKISQELMDRIQLILRRKGMLLDMTLIYVLKEKPYFLWCTYLQFDKEQLVRNLHQNNQFWMMNKQYVLNFISPIPTSNNKENFPKPNKRSLSNQEKENQQCSQDKSRKSVQLTNRSTLLTNRSFSNRSYSICKVSQNKGSITQRTEIIEKEELPSLRQVRNSARTINPLKLRLQEIQLNQLL